MIHETLEISGSHNITGSLLLPLLTEETTLAPGGLAHLNGKTYVCNGTNWLQLAETLQTTGADVEYLVVAGGGGGGGYGGSSYNVGNAGTDSSITSAGGTSFTTVTSIGGGRGGVWNNTSGNQDGGSGGGESGNTAAGSGTNGQGNDGGARGTVNGTSYYNGSGGGGGAGSAGGDGTGTVCGSGGDGKQSSITGTSTYYAGGGGGGAGTPGSSTVTTAGNGGQGGGGNGAVDGAGSAGTANTGGGGGSGDTGVGANHGGAGAGGLLSSSLSSIESGSTITVTVGGGGVAGNAYGGSGGSGVAIFAYDSGSFNCAGGLLGDAGNGRKYNQFNTSGTFYIGSSSDFNFVTDNLILHLDAGNSDSYPGSGQTWYDLSGNGYNLTLGTTSCWNSGGWMDFTATGAKYLPGGTLTNIPNTDGECTIQTWTKFLSNPSSCRTLMRGYGADHHVIVDCSSPHLSIGRYDNDTTGGFVDSGFDINSIPNYLSEFHNMVFKLNSTSPYWSYYYDNNLSTPASTITAATGTNNIGFAGVGSYHQNNSTVNSHSQYWGYISVFLAYNGTLTEAQMSQNYNAFTKRFNV